MKTQVASYVQRDKIDPYTRRSGILTDPQSPSGATCVSLNLVISDGGWV